MLIVALTLLASCQDPESRFAGYPEQDALAYELELDVRPAERQLTGAVRYRFRAAEALESIRLDATRGEGWSVEFTDDAGEPLAVKWSDGLAVVRLGRKVGAGTEVAFRAKLAGTPPDGFYFQRSRYGEPLAFTDHYSVRARGWLPCEDHPGDRAAFELSIAVPAGNEVLASGRVTGREERDDALRLRTETRSDIPPYMFAVVVGPYARVAEKGDPRLVPHLIYRRDVARARPALQHHAEWLAIMERTFGEYAYGKYAVAQCPTRWGGFEAPGAVQVSEGLFDGDDRGVGTLAHELIHMWFGDAVGYAEWREVWLSEGFASYFGPWLHAQTGGPGLRDSLAAMREHWLRSPIGRTRSVRWDRFPHPDLALNANTYPKGAWVLHMLRGELGDEKFFAALRAFYGKRRGTSVLTADFVADVEAVADRDLAWFFDQWLDRPGCPVLRLGHRDGKVVVEQVHSGDPFRFHLTLRWQEAGEPVQRRFEVRDRRSELPVGADAAEIEVDPDVELLFRRVR